MDPIRKKGKHTSDAERLAIIELCKSGHSTQDIAKQTGVTLRTVKRIFKDYLEGGKIVKVKRDLSHLTFQNQCYFGHLEKYIEDRNWLTLRDLQRMLFEETDDHLSIPKIYHILKDGNITYKMTQVVPMGRNSSATKAKRHIYGVAASDDLVTHGDENWFYIDEVGFNGNTRNSHGRAPKGKTPEALKTNLNTFHTSCCAIMSKWGLVALKFVRGGFTNETFRDFALEFCQRLVELEITNATIILDNVKFHHNEEVGDIFENYDVTVRFLPPYSPFLNPIENLFSKWKNLVTRELQESVEDVRTIAREQTAHITARDCHQYYKNAHSYLLPSVLDFDITLDDDGKVPFEDPSMPNANPPFDPNAPIAPPNHPGIQTLLDFPTIIMN